jgi:hypothetical protein
MKKWEKFKNDWLWHVRRPGYPQKTIDNLNKEWDEMLEAYAQERLRLQKDNYLEMIRTLEQQIKDTYQQVYSLFK